MSFRRDGAGPDVTAHSAVSMFQKFSNCSQEQFFVLLFYLRDNQTAILIVTGEKFMACMTTMTLRNGWTTGAVAL